MHKHEEEEESRQPVRCEGAQEQLQSLFLPASYSSESHFFFSWLEGDGFTRGVQPDPTAAPGEREPGEGLRLCRRGTGTASEYLSAHSLFGDSVVHAFIPDWKDIRRHA